MHMANELLSIPIAAGTLSMAAGALGLVCHKVKTALTSERMALMGIMGAFVFAAQMVNIPLPGMPGTSGHMIGAVLLAIVLGPHAGAVVISSVVIIQCLIFQDGGLLALGCNIINMALIPAYVGFMIYQLLTTQSPNPMRVYPATMLACLITIEIGAALVPLEAALSGVLVVPFYMFLWTMLGVHLVIGLMEGLLTTAILAFLQQVRPDILIDHLPGHIRWRKGTVLFTLLGMSILIAGGLSLLASEHPDGLEWSYADRPDQPDFVPMTSVASDQVRTVDSLQSRYSLFPDYSIRRAGLGQAPADHEEPPAPWTSFAGVLGSVLTMVCIWLCAGILRKNPRARTTTIP